MERPSLQREEGEQALDVPWEPDRPRTARAELEPAEEAELRAPPAFDAAPAA